MEWLVGCLSVGGRVSLASFDRVVGWLSVRGPVSLVVASFDGVVGWLSVGGRVSWVVASLDGVVGWLSVRMIGWQSMGVVSRLFVGGRIPLVVVTLAKGVCLMVATLGVVVN